MSATIETKYVLKIKYFAFCKTLFHFKDTSVFLLHTLHFESKECEPVNHGVVKLGGVRKNCLWLF